MSRTMSAAASVSPNLQTRLKQALRRFIAAVEPWYDWGATAICRLDQVEQDFSGESEGEAFRVEFQWLGLYLGAVIGPVPPKISAAERDRRKALIASREVAA